MASAVAVALLLLLVVPMMLYTHYETKSHKRVEEGQ
jgi:ABC-type spermidine/putrescine transport system permease subunit I